MAVAERDVIVINGGEVITPLETVRNGRVVIRDGKIAAVGEKREVRVPKGARTISAAGRKVLPGLIETHIHGLCGADCLDGVDGIMKIRKNLPRFGVTGFLPTLYGVSEKGLAERLAGIRVAAKCRCDGAQVLGVHSEGPYFTGKYGAFPETYTPRLPPPRTQDKIISMIKGLVKVVTLSPELKGGYGFIRRLKANGIVAAIGHSDIDERQFNKAVAAGASHVIHLFNAMRRRVPPEIGVAGAGLSDLVLLEDRLTAEVIADGIHVNPVLLKLLVRAKGLDRVVLITDSMVVAGMKPGKYRFRDKAEVISDGRTCRTAKERWLAGTVLTLDRAVLSMSRLTGIPLAQAVRMATLNPARLIGAHRRKGSLEPGKDADLCIADDRMRIQMTLVKGRVVFHRSP